MAKTATPLNVTDLAWTAYFPETTCHLIEFWETGKAATTGFLVAMPGQGDGPATYPAGDVVRIPGAHPYGVFVPGQLTPAFYIKATGSGVSVTIDRLES